jgi:hypothetical protein
MENDYGLADCCEGCILGLQMECDAYGGCLDIITRKHHALRGGIRGEFTFEFVPSPNGDPEDYFG